MTSAPGTSEEQLTLLPAPAPKRATTPSDPAVVDPVAVVQVGDQRDETRHADDAHDERQRNIAKKNTLEAVLVDYWYCGHCYLSRVGSRAAV